MQIDPRRLAVLLAVHRAGGVLAAADVLGLTPSAVSQQVSRLEAEIGVPLLDRQPRGAVLTAAGRVLVETAERIESEVIDATRSLAALQDDVAGTVTVGGFQSVIQVLLAPLVRDLSERLPGVQVLVREVDGDDGQVELRAGDLDLLLIEADTPWGQATPRWMHDVTVLEEPWRVALPAAVAAPTTLDDLAAFTWLGVDPTAAAHRATKRLYDSFRTPPTVAHLYSASEVALSMVADGLGIALLPSLALVAAGEREGVQIASLAGLGTRSVLARHRTTRSEPRREVLAVLEEIVVAADAVTFDDL